MKRSVLYLGFLLLIVVETFVQIAFKFAGDNAAPATLDLPWLGRIARDPWVYLVVAGLGASFVIYMTLIKHAPIGPAFAASQLEIVTVTLISLLWLGETITALQLVGCAAIVGGVVILAVTEEDP